MKQSLIFLLAILLTPTTYADDLSEAKKAFNNGQYDAVFERFSTFAKQGSTDAEYILGLMYDNGYGVKQNYHEAVKWYYKAAEDGNDSAQYNLGNMYIDGRGVRQDYAKAVKWYLLAAKQNSAAAQYNLAIRYYKGEGVRQNKATAKEWFGKSCDNGDQDGCDKYRLLNEQGI